MQLHQRNFQLLTGNVSMQFYKLNKLKFLCIILKYLVCHSHNFLLPYIEVEKYFINSITVIFIFYFIWFAVRGGVSGVAGGGHCPPVGNTCPPPLSGENFYFLREKFASVRLLHSIFNFWDNIFVKIFELSTKEAKLS